MKHSAELPDGRVVYRNSPRYEYNYLIIGQFPQSIRWKLLKWTTRKDLLDKYINNFIKEFDQYYKIYEIKVVPVKQLG